MDSDILYPTDPSIKLDYKSLLDQYESTVIIKNLWKKIGRKSLTPVPEK
jgi:hypothetical protein